MRTPPVYGRTTPPPPGVTPAFWDMRAIVTPDALEDLTGQRNGEVWLPACVNWSDPHPMKLDDDSSAAMGYAAVLREAPDESVFSVLSAERLLALWTRMNLPGRIRTVWEGRFPELVA